MPEYIRALLVVGAFAVPAFYLGLRLSASVIGPREFAVWRNAWCVATIAAFFSGPYYFAFCAILVIVCLIFRATKPIVLYAILLFSVPLVGVPLGTFGLFNSFFELNNARLLSIVLLLPIVLTASAWGGGQRNAGFKIPDILILGYAVLLITLKSENGTQIARSITVYSLDVLVPYFAFSRAVSSLADFRKVLMAFVTGVLPLALIGAFETAKGWYLYSGIANSWASSPVMLYLRREGTLRATGSAASPIVLGFIIMVAIGYVLALWRSVGSRVASITLGVLCVGLAATVSRGPWVGAAVLAFIYLAMSPNKAANFGRVAAIALIALLTPLGDQLLNLLPFYGSVDTGSVVYRQHLFDNSLIVIERNFWFGSSDYWLAPEMKDLLQGEHIIDIVNTYLKVALESGMVGLCLFVGFFATILVGLWRALKSKLNGEPNLVICLRASFATLIAVLVTIATVSSIDFIPYVYWSFAGLCVALIRIAYRERARVPVAGAGKVLALR